jgi:hypothetical protein
MSQELRDPFADLVAEVPSYVVADARAAWAAGARRRTRRRVSAAGVVVVVVALVGLGTGVLPHPHVMAPAGDSGDGVRGYPSQVDELGGGHPLPDRPGPLAAVLESGTATWQAVSPDGQVWDVPQDDPSDSFPPALSDDGRMIGFLSGPTTYVIRDLVVGDETRFPEIGDSSDVPRRETYWASPQAPAFWSPDGTHLLLRGARWHGKPSTDELVLGVDGTVAEVRGKHGYPVGWLDDDTIGWLDVGGPRRARTVALVATDASGVVERALPLDLPSRLLGSVSQWSGTLSPDRGLLALVLQDRDGSGPVAGVLATVATRDGTVLRREDTPADGYCSTSWRKDEPVFLQSSDEMATLATNAGTRLMAFEPGVSVTCVLTAADALGGERHQGVGERLFGNGWLSWHWREAVVAGLLAAVLLVVAAWLWGRGQRRRLRRAAGESIDWFSG